MTTLRIEASRAAQRRQSSSWARIFAVVSANWVWLTPNQALAGQSARLVYSRTAEASRCANEQELRQAVARRLGYDPFVAVSMNTVVAELRGDGEGLKARVYVIHDGNSAGGARELTAPTRNCTELIAAVALAMSIAVDPDALDRPEPALVSPVVNAIGAEKPPEVAPPGVTVANETSAETPAPRAATTNSKDTPESHPDDQGISSRKPSEAVSVSVGIAASGATGLAPAPVFGWSLIAATKLHNWAVSLEPEATLPSTSATTSSGASVRAWTLGGTVSGAYYLGQLYAGALVDAVVFSARGQNVDHPRVRHPVFWSTGLRVGYAWKVGDRITLMPRLDGLFALSRMTLQLNQQDAYKTPAFLGRIGVGLDYRF